MKVWPWLAIHRSHSAMITRSTSGHTALNKKACFTSKFPSERWLGWNGRLAPGHLPETRNVRLHASITGGNIRLALIDTTKTDVAVGACRSGGYRIAVDLRVH
jgi:hypothetical protein